MIGSLRRQTWTDANSRRGQTQLSLLNWELLSIKGTWKTRLPLQLGERWTDLGQHMQKDAAQKVRLVVVVVVAAAVVAVLVAVAAVVVV